MVIEGNENMSNDQELQQRSEFEYGNRPRGMDETYYNNTNNSNMRRATNSNFNNRSALQNNGNGGGSIVDKMRQSRMSMGYENS
jgi:hypothetical protein